MSKAFRPMYIVMFYDVISIQRAIFDTPAFIVKEEPPDSMGTPKYTDNRQ